MVLIRPDLGIEHSKTDQIAAPAESGWSCFGGMGEWADGLNCTTDENRCWFAWRVIDVRRVYGLTVDRRKTEALSTILAACPKSSPDKQTACPPARFWSG